MDEGRTAKIDSSSSDFALTLEFLYRLAHAYLASGEQTAEVESMIRDAAYAYGFKRVRVVAFPTAFFLAVYDGTQEHVTLSEGPTQNLRLDQVGEVYQLGLEAQSGTISPADGIDRLDQIHRKPARFGLAGSIGGHAILSLGLAMAFVPSMGNILACAVLGGFVGALKLLQRARPLLSVHMPVLTATLVSALVFLMVKWHLPVDPLYALIPPLVTFLPGARLTMGMVELAYGDMVAGSSRLITGCVQLLLLAVGLLAGAMLVGYSATNLIDAETATKALANTPWSAWVGVSLFALGVFLNSSAPPGSFRWMLLVVLVAHFIQQSATPWFSRSASGFLGMLVVTPLCYLIQFRFRGPPAMVTFLPGFWVLVPGAFSLMGVKHMLSDRAAGFDALVEALFALVWIALGTLLGASLSKWTRESYRWWNLQLLRFAQRIGLGG